MTYDINYDTADLLEVVQTINVIEPYWLQAFFPRIYQSSVSDILFDEIETGERRLAPFVSPNVQGRVQKEKGFSTKTFRPAYVKPKDIIRPDRGLTRRAGEQPVKGTLTPQQRIDAIVADLILSQKQRIYNRWEWMAAKAVIDGKVTVVGEDYPSVTVDFGRDADLTGLLVGAARWGQSGADPLADLATYRRLVNQKTGTNISRVTMGIDAWDLFLQDPQVQKLLDTRYRGSETVLNTALSDGTPQEYRGRISGPGGGGSMDIYTYAVNYEGADGSDQAFLDQLTVVGAGAGIGGVRAFGAILDHDAQLASVDIFTKQYTNPDPSVKYILSQSAPLMIPTQPNASFSLKVSS